MKPSKFIIKDLLEKSSGLGDARVSVNKIVSHVTVVLKRSKYSKNKLPTSGTDEQRRRFTNAMVPSSSRQQHTNAMTVDSTTVSAQ